MTLQRVDTTYRGKPTHYYELDGQRVDGATTLRRRPTQARVDLLVGR